jgi:tetratricopeptide (TPR) repeat protein
MRPYIGIWDAHTAKLLTVLKGQSKYSIDSICFSPDGKRILSGSDNGTIWDAFSYKPLLTLSDDGSGSRFLSFSPDGTRILSAEKNTIKIWDSKSAYNPESEKLTFAQDVITALQADTRLDPELRSAALRYVQTHGDSPTLLTTESWNIVKTPDGSAQAYLRALQMAEVLNRLMPRNGLFMNTLGIAQYRNGAYADALATLTKSQELFHPDFVAKSAFIAMSNFRLGHVDQARAQLNKLRAALKYDPNAEEQGFLREAEALIGRR